MTREQKLEAMLVEAHRLAFEKLRGDPELIGQVRQVIERWQSVRGASTGGSRLDSWRILLSLEIDQIQLVLEEPRERGAQLRKLSPLPFVLSDGERMSLRRLFNLPVAPSSLRELGLSASLRTP